MHCAQWELVIRRRLHTIDYQNRYWSPRRSKLHAQLFLGGWGDVGRCVTDSAIVIYVGMIFGVQCSSRSYISVKPVLSTTERSSSLDKPSANWGEVMPFYGCLPWLFQRMALSFRLARMQSATTS